MQTYMYCPKYEPSCRLCIHDLDVYLWQKYLYCLHWMKGEKYLKVTSIVIFGRCKSIMSTLSEQSSLYLLRLQYPHQVSLEWKKWKAWNILLIQIKLCKTECPNLTCFLFLQLKFICLRPVHKTRPCLWIPKLLWILMPEQYICTIYPFMPMILSSISMACVPVVHKSFLLMDSSWFSDQQTWIDQSFEFLGTVSWNHPRPNCHHGN